MPASSDLRDERGSVLVTAMAVMVITLALGLALLSLVDTQTRASGTERTRDRAFNLADSALSSAAFSLSRSWPSSAALAPSNSGATGTAGVCSTAGFGATLGAATAAGSATAKLQPNLNATYTDSAYVGASWQVNICDDDTSVAAGAKIWKDALLGQQNYDANNNQFVWVRAQATVAGRTRAIAALVGINSVPAMSSKYGLITGRLNSDLTNTAGAILTGGLIGSLTSSLLGADPLVAADPGDPTSGVTAVRCGALDNCLTGALAAAGSLTLINTMITGGKLVQATSPTAASDAAIAQLKQQAIASSTYVSTPVAGKPDPNDAGLPACPIPAAASASTIVYIEQIGTSGGSGNVGGVGDQFCYINVATTPAPRFKALVIGRGRVVLRGAGTFTGLVYALNQQRDLLGDASLPTREVIRLDKGAHVVGGVAADGKSAQVGVYPPAVCTSNIVLGVDLGCALSNLTSMAAILNAYNPAIQNDVATMDAVKIYDRAAVVSGTYRDISGELK